ncbi:MAG: adenylate/guanylate cyclase domain-containing protein [Opitutaceae bacterium]
MSLEDDLNSEVQKIFKESWNERDGQKVPESESLALNNAAVKIDGTVLYADLDESTNLVDNFNPHFAAEIYKTYLICAARIIKSEGGVITSYDGDRIMAVYLGESKNTSATRTALKINYAVSKIINPSIQDCYKTPYTVKQTVGIDTSNLFVARTGIRGANDLVWVGRSANYAAKLTSLPSEYPSRITEAVYNTLNKSVKFSSNGESMWEKVTWNTTSMTIYRSTWLYRV